ncbi:MAG: sulfotransferase domain-containing protein [Cyclobacteriaceae bacterium]|nr:sulfotransferase domain-containing protein [Cyclobacteriaceae bacterium]
MSEIKPSIYFHVGLERTATTFLQRNVFPHFNGVHYIPKKQYRVADEIMQQNGDGPFFISHEFDRGFEDEIIRFAGRYPHTKTIIVLRPHTGWLVSQYKRYLKNGYNGSFETFFDLDNDQGIIRHASLSYSGKIDLLTRSFHTPPLVLLYPDIQKDPKMIIQKIASYLGASHDPDQMDLSPRHTSYSEKQLKVLRTFFSYFPAGAKKKWMRYAVLYAAYLIPEFLLNRQPLISEDYLARIQEAYKKDWENCLHK